MYVKPCAIDMQQLESHSVRLAASADAPFLARMVFEASLSPFDRSFWDDLLKETGTGALDFLEAMLREGAANWGAIEDFIILEVDGTPAAACAVFAPDEQVLEGPLNLRKLDQVSNALSWRPDVAAAFHAAYQRVWDAGADFLKPQADVIIESVAVASDFRGRGLGDALMDAAFSRAREKRSASLGVMVVHGNDAAKALYEKYFEPYVTYHAAYFDHEFPGLTKFLASLSD